MTFSEYIISERSEEFYFSSLIEIMKCRKTLEEYFSDMYTDYKYSYLTSCSPTNCRHGY